MNGTKLTEEQREHAQEEVRRLYANALSKLSHLSLGAMAFFFIAYITGVIPGKHSPVEIVPLLQEPAHAFLEKTGGQAGWVWLRELAYGDTLSFAAIAFISSISIFLFAVSAAAFFKRRLNIYGWIALVQLLMFVLAASGLITGGH